MRRLIQSYIPLVSTNSDGHTDERMHSLLGFAQRNTARKHSHSRANNMI